MIKPDTKPAKPDAVASPWRQGLIRYGAYPFIAAAVVMGFAYVYRFGVNVIWEDQWDNLLPVLQSWYNGTLSFQNFWSFHSEHRLLFPRIAMFAMALATHWNALVEMYVTEAGMALVLAAFVYAFARTCTATGRLWLMVPAAFLVFSFRQNQNMLFGDQVCCAFVIVAATAAFLGLHLVRDDRYRLPFLGAAAGATVACYSLAPGLFVWPAGFLQILVLPISRRRKFTLAAVWLVFGAAEWGLYFWGYVKPAYHPPYSFSCQYLAALLGSGLFPGELIATVAGFLLFGLLVAALVLAWRAGSLGRLSFWLAAVAFSLLVLIAITVGRAGFGVPQALSSRYATFSIIGIIGIYSILAMLAFEKAGRASMACWGILLGLTVLGLAVSQIDGYAVGGQMKQTKEYYTFVFYTSDSQPDEALSMGAGPKPDGIRKAIAFLKERHLSIFAYPEREALCQCPPASLPELPAVAEFHVDNFARPRDSHVLWIIGWAADPAAKDAVGGVCLQLDGRLYRAYYGLDRPDVAAAIDSGDVTQLGFQRMIPIDQLAPGRHRLLLRALTKDQTAFYKTSAPMDFDIAP